LEQIAAHKHTNAPVNHFPFIFSTHNAIEKAGVWHVLVNLMAQQIPKCHANCIKPLGSVTLFANLEKENLPNVLQLKMPNKMS